MNQDHFPTWLRISGVLARFLGFFCGTAACREILVVLPGGFGDVLIASGALSILRDFYVNHRITVVCEERCVDFVSRLGFADRIFPLWGQVESVSLLARVQRILEGIRILVPKYKAVFHCLFSTVPVAHAFCRLARAQEKVWYCEDVTKIQEEEAGIYTRLVIVDRDVHEIDKILTFLKYLGIPNLASRANVYPKIRLTAEEEARAQNLTAEGSIAGNKSLLLAVCPGARFPEKDWGRTNFQNLFKQIGGYQATKIFLLGSNDEKEEFDKLVSCFANGEKNKNLTVVNLAGQLSLLESAAIIEACDICVGNDTFGLHMAIAMDTPSVVVLGGGDSMRWAPWGDPFRHLAAKITTDCSGCGWQCKYSDFRCVNLVSVEQVVFMIHELAWKFCIGVNK